MRTRFFLHGTLALALGGVASLASAIPVSAVNAQWSSAAPAGVTISGPGAGGSTTASWGRPLAGAPSSYVFTPAAAPFDAPANGTPFTLGTFVHNNFPVTGTWLQSIVLNLGTTIGGATYAFSFDFQHEETPNSGVCAYPGPACSDRVTVDGVSSSNEFDYLGQTYSFSIVGFEVGGTPTSAFITTERAVNQAQLIASITRVEAEVPEPFTLGLLGAGFLGIAAVGRARRND
jgi:hypothetical protein